MIEKHYTIKSSTGFARPARILVEISNKYLSKLVLEYKRNSVELNYSLHSVMEVMSLGIIPGSQFIIRAKGVDAHQVLQLIEDHFNKMDLIN
ncbi:HPr family phosphocarrier protein [Neobacillus vireti]|uniref:HPr family phosphocarrier protein n=1 Tax=Neobacillus vireti TaxID=220686 RepID=UPI002FFE172C